MEDAKVAANMTPLLGESPAMQAMPSLEHGIKKLPLPGLNRLTQGEELLDRDDVWN